MYRKLFPKARAHALETLSTKELNYVRLFNYRAVLNDTVDAIARGQECRWDPALTGAFCDSW